MILGIVHKENPKVINELTSSSITCRLPQTPRTPNTGAAHYFDDIFTTKGKPKKPNHLRRSSTSRSIGIRSDLDATDDDEDDGEDYNDDFPQMNRSNSVGYFDEETMKRKAEMDKHVAHYVNDQLQRIRTHRDPDSLDKTEFETSVDGASDSSTNGNGFFSGDEKASYFDKSAARRG